jgi:hypothetical protein
MGALLISSHPRHVREAIEQYRREIDRVPRADIQEVATRFRGYLKEPWRAVALNAWRRSCRRF